MILAKKFAKKLETQKAKTKIVPSDGIVSSSNAGFGDHAVYISFKDGSKILMPTDRNSKLIVQEPPEYTLAVLFKSKGVTKKNFEESFFGFHAHKLYKKNKVLEHLETMN